MEKDWLRRSENRQNSRRLGKISEGKGRRTFIKWGNIEGIPTNKEIQNQKQGGLRNSEVLKKKISSCGGERKRSREKA